MDTFASSCPSFIVSSTPSKSKWYVSLINHASAAISSSATKYWGWVKYRYRQVIKLTFKSAKIATLDALNSCPLKTICHFINWSWRFHSAYRQGLTGKAAAWAVKKQYSHHAVSEQAHIAMERLAPWPMYIHSLHILCCYCCVGASGHHFHDNFFLSPKIWLLKKVLPWKHKWCQSIPFVCIPMLQHLRLKLCSGTTCWLWLSTTVHA